jgi:hypothetical protein
MKLEYWWNLVEFLNQSPLPGIILLFGALQKKKKNSSQSLFVLCFFFIEKKEIREEHKLLLGEMSQRNKKLRNEGKERIDFGQ